MTRNQFDDVIQDINVFVKRLSKVNYRTQIK